MLQAVKARGMLVCALALALSLRAAAQPLPRAVQADRIVVHKAARTLWLYWHGAPLKAYRVSAGGGVEIHGLRDGFDWLGSAHAIFDWTDGCIAVTNAEIDELVRSVPDGTPIEIDP